MVQAGFAQGEITPEPGISIAGYFHDRKATGVKDPLWVRALALGDGERRALVLAFDLIGLGPAQAAAIRREVAAGQGLPEAAIHLACSHTHTGPCTLGLLGIEPAPGYLRRMVATAVATAGEALGALAPHRAAVGVGTCPGIAFNRRFVMREGPVRTNPGLGNPDIVRPAGPVDEQVVALLLEGEQRDLVLANFALHLDTVGGTEASADYPYFAGLTLAAGWPRPVEMVFVNGAFGDINHLDVTAPRPAATAAIGEALGRALLETLGRRRELGAALGCAAREIALPRRRLSAEQVAWAERTAREAPAGSSEMEHVYAREQLLLAALPPTVETRVSALRLGEGLRYVFLPGECFVELGLAVKAALGPGTVAVANANGYIGYVATEQAYAEGGYEVRPARSSQMAPGAGEQLVKEAVAVARGDGDRHHFS